MKKIGTLLLAGAAALALTACTGKAPRSSLPLVRAA